jgi:hypothetical protein
MQRLAVRIISGARPNELKRSNVFNGLKFLAWKLGSLCNLRSADVHPYLFINKLYSLQVH